MAYRNKKDKIKYQKEYREKNKDKLKVNQKKYYEENKDRSKKYKEEHKDRLALKSKEWIEKHKDELKIKQKEYRERLEIKIKRKEYRKKNKKRIKAQIKKYKECNKDEIKFKNKQYKKKNKEKIRENYQKSKKAICIICGESALVKYCSSECTAIGNSGENNFMWKGGKSFDPYPITWTNEFKRGIRKRDAYLCAVCNRHQDEFNRSHCVHHIDGDKMNTTEKNCISLCLKHHSMVEKSGDEKYIFWKQKFQKILKRLYGYEYN